jgi:hypothetical protein
MANNLDVSRVETEAREISSQRRLKDPVEFKKGLSAGGGLHEEPTLLSFFFLFHKDSPLLSEGDGLLSSTNKFSAGAVHHIKHVITPANPQYGELQLARLNSFRNILYKINNDMPWFWQSVSGLDTARLVSFEDPFQGAEKPKIEIECLEENIELTATSLMNLYRDLVWDQNRKARILPVNVSRFTMDVFVTEIRSFQSGTASALLGSKRGSTKYENLSNQSPSFGKNIPSISGANEIGQGFTNEDVSNATFGAKPIIQVRLYDCEFDLNSASDVFTDLSKNPETKKPKIAITFQRSEIINLIGGLHLPLDGNLKTTENYPNATRERNAYDPSGDGNNLSNMIKGVAADAKEKILAKAQGLAARAKNLTKVTSSGGALGNIHGTVLTGPAKIAAEGLLPTLGSLFLGNVHGLNAGSTIQDAINTGSFNAILPLLSNPNLAEPNDKNRANSTIAPTNIYDNLNINRGLAGSEISPKNIYDGINKDTLDSSPDGNLNDNVYE